MTLIEDPPPPFWVLPALWASTSRWRAPDWLPAPDRAMVSTALRGGWTLRRASPRWDTIWQPYMRELAQMGVIVLPGCGDGLGEDEQGALIRVRMVDAGFRLPDPDPLALRSAAIISRRALAPVWLGALGSNTTRKGPR